MDTTTQTNTQTDTQRFERFVQRATTVLLGLAIVAIVVGLAGCASAPTHSGRTRVVLLPDEDGKVGALSLSSGGASENVDRAWQASSVQGQDGKPTPPQGVDRAELLARHAALLQAQPLAAKTLVVYFLLDKAVLTDESKALLPAVLAAVKERKPTEVTIFGHADPSGSRERNLRLSAERAQAVADWLRAADPTLDAISVQYFGDRQPPSDADAGKDPARFRRAEIQIL
jgi:outer membrane protein OmpA-like peptidoglycan-associated protein